MNRSRTAFPILTTCVLLIAGAFPSWAGPFDPPAGYYDSATGTGATLQLQLHNIIDSHVVRSYGDARFALPLIDPDDNVPGNIILVYNGQSVPSTWDAGLTWNREHTWPRSRGVGTSGPDNSDLHMLRPCNPSVNGSRSNKPFNEPTTTTWWDPGQLDAFEFGFRGEMARAMFYAAVRYDGSDSNTEDLELTAGFPGTNQMGDLNALLNWHYEQAPDVRERRRNHVIYSPPDNPQFYQFNRNPFIDHPEFVWAIWGPSPNDSTVFVGANPNADGSSEQILDLGRVIVGEAPGGVGVEVMKMGADPTTWEAFSVGDLLDVEDVTHRAFTGGAQSSTIPLTFAPTVTTGVVGGQLIIDNTDLTSAGAGQGVADADDTVTVLATAVDHSTGSFQSGAAQTTLNLDLGEIEQDSVAPIVEYDVFNLGADPTFTADLVIESVGSSGDTAALSTDLFAGETISAGQPRTAVVFVDTGVAPGSYSASYTFGVADEPIPGGATGTPLTLNLSVEILAALCQADLNGDGVVDTADLGQLIAAFGAGEGLPSDLNGDGVVDTADLGILIGEFGQSCD